MSKQEIGYSENRIFLCIDASQKNELTGRATHQALGRSIPFFDVSQMLLAIDTLLEQAGFPEAFTKPRAFARASRQPRAEATESPLPPHGKPATFLLQVRYRQNTSWQGTLTWVETGKLQAFYSDLELIQLITAALA